MKYPRSIQIGILILVVELILIGLWFYQAKPESESSMGVFTLVPILFGANIILGLVSYFFNKAVGLLLFANSVLCPLLFYAVWIMWFTYWAR